MIRMITEICKLLKSHLLQFHCPSQVKVSFLEICGQSDKGCRRSGFCRRSGMSDEYVSVGRMAIHPVGCYNSMEHVYCIDCKRNEKKQTIH